MPDIRVLIVEDEPLIAEDISDFVEELGFVSVGIAYNSEKAIYMIENAHPDIALLDINIEGDKDGIEVAQIIREKYHIPFIYLTSHSDKATLDKAKATLPYGYILKPFNEKDLLTTMEMALFRHASENKVVLPSIEKINQLFNTNITPSEYKCIQQLAEGKTNKQMAADQFVSVNTIKTHLKNLFTKLDVPNRTSVIHKVMTKA